MLLASPHAGFIPAFRFVICFHSPIAPAQSSGGALNEWRTTAAVFPSAATESTKLNISPEEMDSPDLQRFSTRPVGGSTVAILLSPPAYCAKRMRLPSGVHVSQLGEAFIPGVTFRASPPETLMVKMSLPVEPSSLIRPARNAICLPSGDQAGLAICSVGL